MIRAFSFFWYSYPPPGQYTSDAFRQYSIATLGIPGFKQGEDQARLKQLSGAIKLVIIITTIIPEPTLP